VLIAMPSTCSEPSSCTSRHSAETKVDLPEPVRPTMPTLVGLRVGVGVRVRVRARVRVRVTVKARVRVRVRGGARVRDDAHLGAWRDRAADVAQRVRQLGPVAHAQPLGDDAARRRPVERGQRRTVARLAREGLGVLH